jgi:hypothetical protein
LSFSIERVTGYVNNTDGSHDFDPELEPMHADMKIYRFSDGELCAIVPFFVENVWFNRI